MLRASSTVSRTSGSSATPQLTRRRARGSTPHVPNVAVLGGRLPDGDSTTACHEVRWLLDEPPACLMLTSFSNDKALFTAIMAGASGYPLKQIHARRCFGTHGPAQVRREVQYSVLSPAVAMQQSQNIGSGTHCRVSDSGRSGCTDECQPRSTCRGAGASLEGMQRRATADDEE